jgi:hypothetical protein
VCGLLYCTKFRNVLFEPPGLSGVSCLGGDLLGGLDGVSGGRLDRIGGVRGGRGDGLCLFSAAEVPVVDEAGLLDALRAQVGGVAGEEEVVARLDAPGCWGLVSGVCKCEWEDGGGPKRMKTAL